MAANVARAPGLIPAEALACIPGCEGGDPPQAVALLAGGRGCNRVLRVDTRLGRFVWRQRELPVNRAGARAVDELRAHRLAAEAGLAPAVVAADPAGRWLLMEYIDAPVWDEARLCSAAGAARLAAQLARLHSLPVPADWQPVDAVAMADDYLRELAVVAPDRAAGLAPVRARILELGATIRAAGLPCVLNHGDLSASNLLGETPLLVDWEYAQVADPGWDLACLLTYYPEISRHLPALLAGTKLDATAGGVLDLQRQRFALLNRLWEQVVTCQAG
jgi:aminoglycoside phosphotransferase (APT) family kinase protein